MFISLYEKKRKKKNGKKNLLKHFHKKKKLNKNERNFYKINRKHCSSNVGLRLVLFVLS